MASDPHLGERLAAGTEIATLLENAVGKSPRNDVTARYVVGLALEFRSNLNAALLLSSRGFDSEVWTIGRSMAEKLIRLKWVYRRKTNAQWIVIGTEVDAKKRFESQKRRFRNRRAVIEAFDKRLQKCALLPKSGRYWDKRRQRLRGAPTIKQMAEEGHMMNIYDGPFYLGSDHTHGSHRVLSRRITIDDKGVWTFGIDAPPDEESAFATHHVLTLAILFLDVLAKNGWAVNNDALQASGRRFQSIKPSVPPSLSAAGIAVL